jgi:hypothetical protein
MYMTTEGLPTQTTDVSIPVASDEYSLTVVAETLFESRSTTVTSLSSFIS